MNVLILGIGNVLLSDEGLGVKVVEDILARYLLPEEVTVVDGGTMGLDLLSYLDGRTHMFIVDAIRSEREPGAVVRLELDDPPAYFHAKISPHQLGLSELLAVASLSGNLPGKIILFGGVPKDLSTGLELSAEAGGCVPRLSGLIVDELKALGLPVEEMSRERTAVSEWPGAPGRPGS